jgi:beta-galactosidase/beta-glucuronidase
MFEFCLMKTRNNDILLLFLLWMVLNFRASEAQTITLNLSGTWSFQPSGSSKTTLAVPGFYVWKANARPDLPFPSTVTGPWMIVEGKAESIYETSFQIPAEMRGKRLFLRFESINFLADIELNQHFIKRHIGGYLPFEIDITNHVDTSSTNQLTVAVKYWDSSFLDASNLPVWPVGFYDNYWCLGITGDVSIIARNSVYTENIYVQTSVSQKKIDAVISLTNADLTDHTVLLQNRVERDGSPVLSWSDQSILVPAGDTIKVSLTQNWSNPHLWWPDDPFLYQFVSCIKEGGVIRDTRSERFGFRDFKLMAFVICSTGLEPTSGATISPSTAKNNTGAF